MHKLNIFISGSESFKSTLQELKSYFKFNIISNQKNFSEIKKIDGIICDEEIDFSNHEKKYLIDKDCFKIIAIKKDKIKTKNFDYVLKLPVSVEDINSIIENPAFSSQTKDTLTTKANKLGSSYLPHDNFMKKVAKWD